MVSLEADKQAAAPFRNSIHATAMRTLSRSATVPVEFPAIHLEEAWREPLAVLVMSTQILNQYGGRLSPELRQEQRARMQAAGALLTASLQPPAN